MHFLVTGHTGFKGSWLVLLLKSRGHTVSGISLDPLAGSLFEIADVAKECQNDLRIDIRNRSRIIEAVQNVSPDVVLHLAAQPLVRESYKDPYLTYETNVMGTLHVIEAVAKTESVKAHVIITTDKVYRNVNQVEGYVESDPLGGFDPYSSSKAMADIMSQSWVNSFPGVPTAIARAGNVIGGGDVSKDRLLVDLLSAFEKGSSPLIRYPSAVRPWQHVLDCLSGYLSLADALLEGKGQGEWNFGPGRESFVSVGEVADLASELWGDGAKWSKETQAQPHEAELLALDSTKALSKLKWKNLLPYPLSLEWTIQWQKDVLSGTSPFEETKNQIQKFEGLQQT